jgi:hypothetical protein
VKLTGVRWHSAGNFSGALPEGGVREKPRRSSENDALVRSYIDKDFDSSGRTRYLLALENIGYGQARDIEVRLDDIPVAEHSAVFVENEITQIGPQSRCHYQLVLASGRATPSRVSVTWMNESGEPGEFNSDISL